MTPEFKKFIEAITPLYGEGEARSIARIVFEDAFQIYDFTKGNFPKKHLPQLNSIQKRLLNHEPVQYILGEADFYGLKFSVNESVLIPRPETEELVHWIIQTIGKKASGISILDIGTGSGCIPITLKKELPNCQVFGCDISLKALAIAKENAEKNKVEVDFLEVDILDQNQWKDLPKFDIIISNPPYIPSEEQHLMPKNVLQFEPHLALFVENKEPLIFYQTITEFFLEKAKSNAWLFFEMNEFNANKVFNLLTINKLNKIEIQKDMQDKDRMIRGQFFY